MTTVRCVMLRLGGLLDLSDLRMCAVSVLVVRTGTLSFLFLRFLVAEKP